MGIMKYFSNRKRKFSHVMKFSYLKKGGDHLKLMNDQKYNLLNLTKIGGGSTILMLFYLRKLS